MVAESKLENNEGNCYQCDFYDKEKDYCRRAERAFGSMRSPICLAKIQVILLRDMCVMLDNYLYEDDEDNT